MAKKSPSRARLLSDKLAPAAAADPVWHGEGGPAEETVPVPAQTEAMVIFFT